MLLEGPGDPIVVRLHGEDAPPPLVRAGGVHARVASIHPFLDGCGRAGRLLIALLFERWRLLGTPLLRLGAAFRRHQREYRDRLAAARTGGDGVGWTGFFLGCAREPADDAVDAARRLHALIGKDPARVVIHEAATVPAVRLSDPLPGHPRVPVGADRAVRVAGRGREIGRGTVRIRGGARAGSRIETGSQRTRMSPRPRGPAMSVRRLGRAACRSYLLACDRTRRAVLVDPLLEDLDATARLLEAEGLAVDWIVDTHTHADHRSAGPALAERTGAPYALHEATTCARATERLEDGQVLEAGDLRVEVLHTPGHTADSATLRCGRDLLTGDFLFLAQDGAGRLDLPGGDAGAHWDSLRRLAALDDGTRVLPGHDYHELDDSTLGVERRRNPRFQEVTREEYVAWQRAVAAPAPDWMLDVIAANLGTAAAHGAHHAPRPVDLGLPACPTGGACATAPSGRVPLVEPREALRRLAAPAGRPFFLDVREPHETRAVRAEGVETIPLPRLPASLDRLPADRGAEILVICKAGGRSAAAAEALIERGWRRVFSVAGGTDRWAADGLPVRRG